MFPPFRFFGDILMTYTIYLRTRKVHESSNCELAFAIMHLLRDKGMRPVLRTSSGKPDTRTATAQPRLELPCSA